MSNAERKEILVSQDELELQRSYIEKVKAINDYYFETNAKRKRAHIVTFGCQMNAHDSEKLLGMLCEMGYDETDKEEGADLIVYNTCCVRENAENKVYGNLGYLKHFKEKSKDFKIILCGCMMQQGTVVDKLKKSYRYVDIIFGTFNLYRFPELLYTNIETGGQVIDIWEEHKEIIEDIPSIRKHVFKSSVNIMYGCDNFCAYCIVPYVRGRERSRAPQDIVNEIKSLVEDGVKEITLLGQNVNSYGKKLEEKVTFAELLRMIHQIEGLERIKFMTSHPKDLSDELIYTIRDCKKISRYIHLPIQSGSTEVLKKMNRKYTKEKYLTLVEKIKNEIPDAAITTDLIVGFPGETEEDFNETLDVVEKARFSGAFTYIYSIRTGTPAANMEDQVPEAVISERFNRLLQKLNPIVHELNLAQVGQVLDVLVEEVNSQNEELVTGRADNNSIVHFKGNKQLIGNIVKVKITSCKTFYLNGELELN